MRVVALKAKMSVSCGTWYEPTPLSSAGVRVQATRRSLAKNIKTPANTLIHNLPLVELGVGRSLLPPRPGSPYAPMIFPEINFVTDLHFKLA
jgi:hypothetical protein